MKNKRKQIIEILDRLEIFMVELRKLEQDAMRLRGRIARDLNELRKLEERTSNSS